MALYAEECVDGIIGLQLQEVLYGASLCILGLLRYLEAAQPVYAALLCEEHYHVVGIGGIYVFRKVLLTGAGTASPYSTSCLSAEV